jgi:hypothetical protein
MISEFNLDWDSLFTWSVQTAKLITVHFLRPPVTSSCLYLTILPPPWSQVPSSLCCYFETNNVFNSYSDRRKNSMTSDRLLLEVSMENHNSPAWPEAIVSQPLICNQAPETIFIGGAATQCHCELCGTAASSRKSEHTGIPARAWMMARLIR